MGMHSNMQIRPHGKRVDSIWRAFEKHGHSWCSRHEGVRWMQLMAIYPKHDESMRERWKNFQFGNSPEDVGWCGEHGWLLVAFHRLLCTDSILMCAWEKSVLDLTKMVHFGSQVEHEPTVVPKSENPKLADLVGSISTGCRFSTDLCGFLWLKWCLLVRLSATGISFRPLCVRFIGFGKLQCEAMKFAKQRGTWWSTLEQFGRQKKRES